MSEIEMMTWFIVRTTVPPDQADEVADRLSAAVGGDILTIGQQFFHCHPLVFGPNGRSTQRDCRGHGDPDEECDG